MPLHLSRRPGESFTVFLPDLRPPTPDPFLLRVTVARGGGEPLLRVEGRPELVIRRDEAGITPRRPALASSVQRHPVGA